ncbi:hypothetical protein D6764_03905 [Candidatus Woesearchaeota archaeon]|nr:MAG: hypothetical protein D6764_03905 [Candidatus Woesearchaeota archaeon]
MSILPVIDRRGEMGVGTLIIFISMLIVAAVAAGVLIQTTGGLQQRSIDTGAQAKAQISTALKVVDISATDGTKRSVRDFKEIVKLAPGSDPIKLSQLILSMSTYNSTATLNYRGADASLEKGNTGYNTWVAQEIGEIRDFNTTNAAPVSWNAWYDLNFDIDGDHNKSDMVIVCRDGAGFCPSIYDGKYLAFNMSSDPSSKIYVPLYYPNGSIADISAAPDTLGNDGTQIGTYSAYINTRGTTSSAWTLNAGQLVVFLNKTKLNEDLDDDSSDDYVVVNNTHAIFILSSVGEVPVSLGTDLRTPGAISVDTSITYGGTTYGTLLISGTTTYASAIDESVTFRVTPQQLNKGYFVAEYLEKSSNWVNGNIQTGDVVRLYFEAPRNIGEDEEVRITIIPKSGLPLRTIFVTPSVISTYNVHLYP